MELKVLLLAWLCVNCAWCDVAEEDETVRALLFRLARDLGTTMADVKAIVWEKERSHENDVISPGHVDVGCAGVKGLTTVYMKEHVMTAPCDGNGWLVVMNREDGAYNFPKRTWEEYKHGFGNPSGSFWLGLEHMHRLTQYKAAKLRIELEDWEGEKAWAQYDYFRLLGEDTGYRLLVDGFSGTAGDSLKYHNGMKFSTIDRDNDNNSGQCADAKYGGWWFDSCFYSSLTAKYHDASAVSDWHGLIWYEWRGKNYSLKAASMKVMIDSD